LEYYTGNAEDIPFRNWLIRRMPGITICATWHEDRRHRQFALPTSLSSIREWHLCDAMRHAVEDDGLGSSLVNVFQLAFPGVFRCGYDDDGHGEPHTLILHQRPTEEWLQKHPQIVAMFPGSVQRLRATCRNVYDSSFNPRAVQVLPKSAPSPRPSLPSISVSNDIAQLHGRQFRAAIVPIIRSLTASPCGQISFPLEMTSLQRRMVHEMADAFHLQHQSTGMGRMRQLQVTKPPDSSIPSSGAASLIQKGRNAPASSARALPIDEASSAPTTSSQTVKFSNRPAAQKNKYAALMEDSDESEDGS